MAKQGRAFLPVDLKQVSSARIGIEIQDLEFYMIKAQRVLSAEQLPSVEAKVNDEIKRLKAELHLRYSSVLTENQEAKHQYYPQGKDITTEAQAIFGEDLVLSAWTIDYPFLTEEEVAETYEATENSLTFTALMGVEFINGKIIMMEADEGGILKSMKGSAYNYGKPRPI